MNSFLIRKTHSLSRTGTYIVLPASISSRRAEYRGWFDETSHFTFVDFTGVSLILNDVTFLMSNNELSVFRFSNDHQFQIRGGIINYETPPYTQGTIRQVPNNGEAWIMVENHPGYPEDLWKAGSLSSIFNPTSPPTLKRNKWADFAPTYVRNTGQKGPLGGSLFVLNLPDISFIRDEHLKVGDLLSHRGKFNYAINIWASSKMSFIDVTLLSSPGFGFYESSGDGGNIYQNVQIKRAPTPPGASIEPLMSTSADGLHSVSQKVGPTITNCLFDSTNDDAIAIHGVYSLITERGGNGLTLVASNANLLQQGDHIRIFDNHLGVRGTWVVSAPPQNLPGYRPPRPTSQTVYRTDINSLIYQRITVDRPLPPDLGFDFVLASFNRLGSGFFVANTVILNNRGRGMLIKAMMEKFKTIESVAAHWLEFYWHQKSNGPIQKQITA
eukprot:TRINITY_DN1268_c0_g1_i3.p1 TRINITY_DN1268_c0_g1~~TRINITY_DN1268_c0_g1_i3.p1  ORF type:complete len:441 (-),score=99.36 TRINITY_DN1268_c0_g1_i3:1183-2505(-)